MTILKVFYPLSFHWAACDILTVIDSCQYKRESIQKCLQRLHLRTSNLVLAHLIFLRLQLSFRSPSHGLHHWLWLLLSWKEIHPSLLHCTTWTRTRWMPMPWPWRLWERSSRTMTVIRCSLPWDSVLSCPLMGGSPMSSLWWVNYGVISDAILGCSSWPVFLIEYILIWLFVKIVFGPPSGAYLWVWLLVCVFMLSPTCVDKCVAIWMCAFWEEHCYTSDIHNSEWISFTFYSAN